MSRQANLIDNSIFIAKHYRRRRAAKRDLENIIQDLNRIINEDDEETSVINSK